MKSPAKVIIVGGGLSGLAAAYTLQQAGFEVRVLEKLDRPGGRVLTLRRDGYIIDAGPDAVTRDYREYLALMDQLGLGNHIVASSPVMGIMRGDRIHDIDPSRPLSAAFTPALSWSGKLSLMLGAMRLKPQLKGIDSFELVESADRDDPSINAQTFSEKIFGREVTDYLIDPAIRLTTGSGARKASSLSVLGAAANWTAQMVNIEGGLDLLPRTLAQRLPVTYGTEVTNIADTDSGVKVEYRDAQNLTRTEQGDYCIIGAMYDVANRIWAPLAKLAPTFGPQLTNIRIISISLTYKTLCSSKAYAVAIPTREYPDLLLAFLQHNKAQDRAPPGHSLITFYTDTLAFERYVDRSDQEIADWAAAIAEKAFPELRGQREFFEVTRWPMTGYLATPGFWRRSRELLNALPADGRVQIAGDLFGAGSMESAVRWGKRIAERVIKSAGRAERA